jgi:hypothetical protein
VKPFRSKLSLAQADSSQLALMKRSRRRNKEKKEIEKTMKEEKNFTVVMKMFPENWKQVEDFLDSVGATVIFVKQTDANRKLVVKNLPDWQEEKENDRTDF